MCELLWLTKEWNWNFVEKTAKAEHFSQRWSLCGSLRHGEADSSEIKQQILEVLSHLKNDPIPVVAAEANFLYERIKIKIGPKLPKADWRKEIERISNLEPRHRFEIMAMDFMRNKTDYTLAEFESYVTEMA